MTSESPAPDPSFASDQFPEDIELDEAGRNWVNRQSAADPRRPLRSLAADAAVTAAIGNAYGSD
ncbi:MAG TPA: hypothetical protein VNH38_07525 [Candidatus Dormibacteraeota bacterium]|nr:hypothetical protein [Candidatus Dormibacteraeota bacterium]